MIDLYGGTIVDLNKIDALSTLKKGDYRIVSYEPGVKYKNNYFTGTSL
jgi:hypothetical protein